MDDVGRGGKQRQDGDRCQYGEYDDSFPVKKTLQGLFSVAECSLPVLTREEPFRPHEEDRQKDNEPCRPDPLLAAVKTD